MSTSQNPTFEGAPRTNWGREDTSNADRFASQHKDLVRFWHGRDKWLIWTGTHWATDDQGQVLEFAKETSKSIYSEAASLADNESTKLLGKWAERSLNRDRIAAMLDLAKSDPRIRVTTEKLDSDPSLLNFTNGTLDLRTAELHEHRRDDLITKLVRHAYRPNLVSSHWNRFLEQTFGPELYQFVQKAVGYSLTGITSEKVVFLLLGVTNAGKTTFLDAVREVFSSYSAALQIETLMWSKNSDNNAAADLADLRGARFVVTSETEEGQRLREAKLKRITQGMGQIKTARKYENPITFPETHKLWIDANHVPIIRGVDDAIWKRLVPIPCNHHVMEPDKNLKAKLLTEAEGIVSWAVAGALRWYNEGLGKLPKPIEDLRSEWREQMDLLGGFINESCDLDESNSDGATELYNAFGEWAKKQGYEHPLTATAFGLRLKDRGFTKGRDTKSGRIVYYGIKVRSLF